MSSVRISTSWFRKLSFVSTLATPLGHLACVSSVLGGTRPMIHAEAQFFSTTWVEGVSPVSTVACQHAARASVAPARAGLRDRGIPTSVWVTTTRHVRTPKMRAARVGDQGVLAARWSRNATYAAEAV